MAKCLFSVVIPLYNMADTIKRTINSALNQTCQDFEIIVVDDGSKDNSASIAQEIDDNRITVIRQPNGGVSVARNNGMEHANGQFITFLDADDEYMPEHLETLKRLIDTYPDYNVYATSYKLIKGGLPKIKNLRFKDYQESCRGG
ncbi:MAG: glycosyltransferase [Prevotella sp.]|nr:glycosyltransferase [Prevotella sp.]